MSRAQLFAIVIVVLALNGLSNRLSAAISGSEGAGLGGIFGLNAIVLFACFAVIMLAAEEDESADPALMDWITIAFAAGLALFPLKAAAALGLLLFVLYTVARSIPRTVERRIAFIGLALAGSIVIGPTMMALIGTEITRLETAVLPIFTTLEASGNVLFARGTGDTLVVGPGCSAFSNLTLGILAVVSFWQLFGIPGTRPMAKWCGFAVLAVFAINTVRLTLIGLYPQQYDYLHRGGGAELFMWANEIAVAGIAMTGVWRAQSR